MNNIRRLLVFKYFKGRERFIDFLIFILFICTWNLGKFLIFIWVLIYIKKLFKVFW